MPRPKVRPENRQRSYRACLSCKSSKIRCDALQPCSSCVRRDQADSCTYSGIDRRRRAQGQCGLSEALSPQAIEDNTPRSDGYAPLARVLVRIAIEAFPLPVMLIDPVFVGEASSQSFLHFLRKTVKAYIGSAPFTDGERQYVTLDVDLPSAGPDISLNTSPNKLRSLLEGYFEATSGILCPFTSDEIELLLHERSSSPGSIPELPPTGNDDAAALDLALAIGAQAGGRGEDVVLSRAYFSRARKVALDNMFTSQNLSTVRLFLLLAFYMLGACNRNGAAMFLGVAVKAAVILQLHNPPPDSDPEKEESSDRMRIWNSIQNVDVLASFILGRPKDLPLMRHAITETKSPNPEEVGQHAQPAFGAMVQVCNLLADIVDCQRKSTGLLHVPSAETQLFRLRQWSGTLPENLRHFSPTASSQEQGNYLEPSDRQALMSAMHISCVYYFAVILITRPFLVAYLISRLRGKAPYNLISDPDEASDINIKNSKVSGLAQVCVSSSLYMVDMCVKAKAANFTFGNLCLLEAWIFGAGLVLGFSMFAGEPRRDIDDSFGSARTIIADLATSSPQAQLYLNILTTFAEAIAVYRQRVKDERQSIVQHYMGRILVIDDPATTSRHNTIPTSGSGVLPENPEWMVNVDGVDIDGADLRTLLEISTGFQDQTAAGNWSDVDMHLLDYPIPGVEPFDQFFYTVE
ncbi:hypothetical protein BJY01DRAFT_262219 [Aspergillus pseudoustus]|uniref:Zn(2)-C6 fungal-type domain-containing protein n=1 Tax=Aspergillus pseudoustus TaxID=1810923 RepID=A0ABR4IG91_9EURO